MCIRDRSISLGEKHVCKLNYKCTSYRPLNYKTQNSKRSLTRSVYVSHKFEQLQFFCDVRETASNIKLNLYRILIFAL